MVRPNPVRSPAEAGPDLPGLASRALPILPGLVVTGSIAAVAFALRSLPGIAYLSPMILAIILAILLGNVVRLPAALKPGIVFGLRRLLRLAIILLGLQLTAQQVIDVGGTGFAIIVVTLILTFVTTKLAGGMMGVDPRLAELIAAGTSICGASAVICTNTVTRGSDEDVAYAVACVTIFGTLSMLLYPVLAPGLGLDQRQYGLWAGASIHEIAQVVAAAFQQGKEAGDFGTITKLSRVMLLAPLVIGLGLVRMRGAGTEHAGRPVRPPMPWFVLGFIALIGVNSLGVVPAFLKTLLIPATTILLTIALAAMGLETNLGKLRAKGMRPLALGAFAWLFISLLSYGLIGLGG